MSKQLPYCYKYPHPAVAVDIAIFTLRDNTLNVLIVERGVEPFAGMWALPGGFVRMDEDLAVGAYRELREETGLTQAYIEQLGAFGRPDRDPRERVISIAFVAIIPSDQLELVAGSDARGVRWCQVGDVPNLAFDHAEIVTAARVRIADKVKRTTIAVQFLPSEFTMSELQAVYEAIRGEIVDKRNFRKWASALSYLKPTGKFRHGGQHRPAALYRATTDAVITMPDVGGESADRSETGSDARSLKDAYRRGYQDGVTALERATIDTRKSLLKSLA
jgi:8-oxo-dGTP diphosphatase